MIQNGEKRYTASADRRGGKYGFRFSSADSKVREKLLDLQRKLAASMSVVMDGRDIGTTILPDADVKIYLTASSQKRAERRYKELTEKGISCCLDEIRRDIEERDKKRYEPGDFAS